MPLSALGITRLGTQAEFTAEGVPWHPGGLELRDGRILPTYDWIVAAP